MNVFDLAAKITLDDKEYEKSLSAAGSKMSDLATKIGSIGNKVASGLATAMKAGAVAVGAASTAVAGLVTQSVRSYAEYEQLVGGVQKLYGNMGKSLEQYAKDSGKSIDEVRDEWGKLEEAQNLVLKNAQNAYKTAGMSANKYMDIATSFSATLINDLEGNTVEAAKMTDKAMVAISDNWNTFGGDLGMIQNAFQGFAKQNYAMLDNLKLGYGGTKQEMQRLIDDANTYAKSIGEAGNLTMDSFADIITAIDLVQQKQNIAGTTQREATTTIQGSLGMVKAAWENLVTGMADSEANLEDLMSNLVDSIAGYTDKTGEHVNGLIDNVLPVAEKALASVSVLIERLGPKIAKMVPELITKVMPSLITAGANIVTALANGIWEALPKLMEMARDLLIQFGDAIYKFDFSKFAKDLSDKILYLFDPENGFGTGIIANGGRIIRLLLDGIMEALPELTNAASSIVLQFIDAFVNTYPKFTEVGLTIIETILQGIDDNIDQLIKAGEILITGIINAIESHGSKLLDLGLSIIEKLTDALIKYIPQIMSFATELILKLSDYVIQNAPKLIKSAVEVIAKFADGLAKALPQILPAVLEMILTIAEGLIDNIDKLIDAAIQLVIGLAEGLIKALPKLIEKAPIIIQKLVDAIIRNVPKLIVAAGEIIGKLVAGIVENFPKIIESGMKIVNTLQTGIVRAIAKAFEAGKQMITKIRDGIKSIDPIQWGKDMIDSFVSGIRDRLSKVRDTAEDVARTIKNILGFSEPEEGPLSNFHTFAPDMMNLFIKGIKDSTQKLQNQIEKSFDFKDAIINENVGILSNARNTATAEKTPANTLSGPITINVYGAEGQDVKELADIVSDRLMHMIGQSEAVYA